MNRKIGNEGDVSNLPIENPVETKVNEKPEVKEENKPTQMEQKQPVQDGKFRCSI